MTVLEVIGLGAMGAPMARRFAAAGYAVRCKDADAKVQAAWQGEFGQPEGTVAAVICCVSDEAASRQVFAQFLRSAAPGTLFVDHTTTSDRWACAADSQAREAGLHWCDAPLSGGVQGAEQGELVAMIGAHEADVPRVRTLLACTTREVVHMGPPGHGQLCKMANQLAIAGVAAGLAQVQAFGRAKGLDLERVYRVLQQGSARSVQLERMHSVLAETEARATATFAWLEKDLALCSAASTKALPIVDLWQTLWEEPT